MKTLNESDSDLLTFNMRSLFGGGEDKDSADSTQETSAAYDNAQIDTDLQRITDWGAELKKRLNRNAQKSVGDREYDSDVEKRFFYEYFSAVLCKSDKEYLKALMQLGMQVRTDITAIGFDEKVNPIIAFLKLTYVKNNLVKPGLLNSNTYKAISTAVRKNLVADTEFFRASDYNIIYCRDLYTKDVDTMIEYIKRQHDSLKIIGGKYTERTQNENKRIFLQLVKKTSTNEEEILDAIRTLPDEKLARASVKSQNAKLNSLHICEKLHHVDLKKDSTNKAKRGKSEKTSVNLDSFVADIKTDATMIFACLQYLSIATGSKAAQEALSKKDLKVKVGKLPAATAKIAEKLSNKTLTKQEADEIVVKLFEE